MAPRRTKKPVEIVETDRLEGFAHPRETLRLAGQDIALGRAARAIRGGRPPQAWLISGPPGVGKATLAYRILRYLLAYGATDKGAENLSVPAKDPVTLQVSAASHPGMLVLKRGLNDQGRLMTVLGVDEIRRLGEFFGMTSGAGGWRVALVDTADDMNDAAANALLKLLEEPPLKSMLLLISNTPGRLLPTIRSRCQRLELRPLDEATLDTELARLLPDLEPGEHVSLARLADGSVGGALHLAGDEGLELAREADSLLDHAAEPDVPSLLALGDRLARMTDGLELFGHFLCDAIAGRIRARALKGAPHLDRWIELLNRIDNSFARTTGLHMEPRQTVLSAARDLSKISRRIGAL